MTIGYLSPLSKERYVKNPSNHSVAKKVNKVKKHALDKNFVVRKQGYKKFRDTKLKYRK